MMSWQYDNFMTMLQGYNDNITKTRWKYNDNMIRGGLPMTTWWIYDDNMTMNDDDNNSDMTIRWKWWNDDNVKTLKVEDVLSVK